MNKPLLIKNNYKHIIWDWNGTLLNDVDLCLDIINGMLNERQIQTLSLEEYKNIFTFPVKDYYEKAGLNFEKYSFDVLGKEWIDQYEIRRNEAQLFAGSIDILNYFMENDIRQSILSAYSQATLEEIVEQFQLKSYFSHIAGLDHIYATSKVQLGLDLMKKLGNGKGETLLIGDTIHDFEVAGEIGADCILIANGHQSKKRLLSCGVSVYDSLNDLLYNWQ